MRRLDGTIPVHSKYGAPVNFFTLVGIRKYWVKSSSPVLGYLLWYIIPFMYFMLIIFLPVEGFFLFHTLDKVVRPFCVKCFDMPIWHPTNEVALDELMAAQVDM